MLGFLQEPISAGNVCEHAGEGSLPTVTVVRYAAACGGMQRCSDPSRVEICCVTVKALRASQTCRPRVIEGIVSAAELPAARSNSATVKPVGSF